VALGPHIPEWKALQTELQELVRCCSADLAVVISTGNVLWCASSTYEEVDELADRFYRTHIAPKRQSLRRGARLDLVLRDPDEILVVPRGLRGASSNRSAPPPRFQPALASHVFASATGAAARPPREDAIASDGGRACSAQPLNQGAELKGSGASWSACTVRASPRACLRALKRM
jgi:hypothetical protein